MHNSLSCKELYAVDNVVDKMKLQINIYIICPTVACVLKKLLLGAYFSVGRWGSTLNAVTSSRSSSQPLGRRWRHRASFPNNAQEKATLTIQTEVRSTFPARLVQESSLRRSTRLLPRRLKTCRRRRRTKWKPKEDMPLQVNAGSHHRLVFAATWHRQVTIRWWLVTVQQSVRFTGSTRRHRVFTASLPLAFLYFLRRWRGRCSRAGWG